MIRYVHNKTGSLVFRDVNAVAFRNNQTGDMRIQLPNYLVEDSKEWTRILPKVKTYPAELVEPLFNCRMEHYEGYVEQLENYKRKIQNS